MLNLNKANSIIKKRYPKSEILAIVETSNYYVYNLSSSVPEMKESVNKKDGKIELLNSLEIRAEARKGYNVIKES